ARGERDEVQRARPRRQGGGRVNPPLSPRDRGNRSTDSKRPSGPPGPVHGAFGLVHGITNDSKHVERHAACKTGAESRAVGQSRGRSRGAKRGPGSMLGHAERGTRGAKALRVLAPTFTTLVAQRS